MERKGVRTYRFAGFLVRRRGFFFALVTVLAVVSAFLIPRIRINSDPTSNLPDSSPMHQGLKILESRFPDMDIRMQTLRVMFVSEPPSDSLKLALESLLPGGRLVEVREDGTHTLYEFMLPRDTDGKAVSSCISARFGDRVIAEIDDKTGMPDNIFMMIGTGVLAALVVLFLMCPSIVEALLFLISIGFAVAINMGTNALLPSIQLVTNNLSAVLQMVLSMDYGIILMNRYRQEKKLNSGKEEAMTAAIANASTSILSSCFTTVAGLLMLVFMRLRIGADLGVVLSKGVICSLITTFTLLPTLILLFDKAVTATEKRTLHIPTDGLARFEMRARVPIAMAFIALAIGSWFLQKQTKISYSADWATKITDVFPARNNLVMLYSTRDEGAVNALTDSISAMDAGMTFISYPDIALRPRTVRETEAFLAGLSPDLAGKIPPEALDLLYYAALHPERTERMRFDELKPAADSLLAFAGTLLPAETLAGVSSRFDIRRMMRGFSLPSAPVQKVETTVEVIETEAPVADIEVYEPELESPVEDRREAAPDTVAVQPRFTYEQITRQRSSSEMAAALGEDAKSIGMVYRIAGAGKRGRPNTLNLLEFMDVIESKVLTNKLYASMMSSEMKERYDSYKLEVEAVVAAATASPEEPEMPAAVDTASVTVPSPATVADTVVTAVAMVEAPEPEAVPETLSPEERLLDMAFSGKRYTSAQCSKALADAGIGVGRSELDLLFLYYGSRTARDTTARLSLTDLISCLEGFASSPLVTQYADSTHLAELAGLKGKMAEYIGLMRDEEWSVLMMTGDLPFEGERTFSIIDRIDALTGTMFSQRPYLVGKSQMYKEIKEAFPRELLVLTLLTVAAIFLIIAVSFRSLLVPLILIPSVLSAVWLNVFISGLGGREYYFLGYLIVQGILMGATIDYSILFTHYYIDSRRLMGKADALAAAYRGAIHAVTTSGLIIIVAPVAMAAVVSDQLIMSVLRGISGGAAAALLIVLLLLPATLVLADRAIVKSRPE